MGGPVSSCCSSCCIWTEAYKSAAAAAAAARLGTPLSWGPTARTSLVHDEVALGRHHCQIRVALQSAAPLLRRGASLHWKLIRLRHVTFSGRGPLWLSPCDRARACGQVTGLVQ